MGVFIFAIAFGVGWVVHDEVSGNEACEFAEEQLEIVNSPEYQSVISRISPTALEDLQLLYSEQAARAIMGERVAAPMGAAEFMEFAADTACQRGSRF